MQLQSDELTLPAGRPICRASPCAFILPSYPFFEAAMLAGLARRLFGSANDRYVKGLAAYRRSDQRNGAATGGDVG